MFAGELCEIQEEDLRYILRRNPDRAEEVGRNRVSKIQTIEEKTRKANQYVEEHPKAQIEVQERKIKAYIGKLGLSQAIQAFAQENKRRIEIKKEEAVLKDLSRLDGCYVIKTNIEATTLNKEEVHRQYKALSMVEWSFRITKSCLEIRPIYLRKQETTRGHLIVCLLAYKIEKYLREKWA